MDGNDYSGKTLSEKKKRLEGNKGNSVYKIAKMFLHIAFILM